MVIELYRLLDAVAAVLAKALDFPVVGAFQVKVSLNHPKSCETCDIPLKQELRVRLGSIRVCRWNSHPNPQSLYPNP